MRLAHEQRLRDIGLRATAFREWHRCDAHQLERDVAAQRRIVRAVDDAHRTLGDRSRDREPADLHARFDRRCAFLVTTAGRECERELATVIALVEVHLESVRGLASEPSAEETDELALVGARHAVILPLDG